jgi:hypothetical protein
VPTPGSTTTKKIVLAGKYLKEENRIKLPALISKDGRRCVMSIIRAEGLILAITPFNEATKKSSSPKSVIKAIRGYFTIQYIIQILAIGQWGQTFQAFIKYYYPIKRLKRQEKNDRLLYSLVQQSERQQHIKKVACPLFCHL